MRQQCCDVACSVGRQTGQDVLEIRMGFVPVELRRADEAHDRSGALTRTQRTGKEPIERPTVITQAPALAQRIENYFRLSAVGVFPKRTFNTSRYNPPSKETELLMRTLGQAFKQKGREDSNNFLLLRLLAASLVVYGHSFALSATTNGLRDFTTSILHYRYSGDLGLHIFFVISGFLVTFSFDRRHSVKDFLISRALRLFPALIVCMALLAFVLGPSLTTLTRGAYFQSSETYGFVWRNASLLEYAGGCLASSQTTTRPTPSTEHCGVSGSKPGFTSWFSCSARSVRFAADGSRTSASPPWP